MSNSDADFDLQALDAEWQQAFRWVEATTGGRVDRPVPDDSGQAPLANIPQRRAL